MPMTVQSTVRYDILGLLGPLILLSTHVKTPKNIINVSFSSNNSTESSIKHMVIEKND